jgi:hypothetical protein
MKRGDDRFQERDAMRRRLSRLAPAMEESMGKLILTGSAGLLLPLSVASVDAAAAKVRPRLTEGRAAYAAPPRPPVSYRFNDFGPDYGTAIPFAGNAG